MKTRIPEALILAIAIVMFGLLVYCGIDRASDRGRVVHVRGLAEMEVPADKVFWTINYGILGDDMPSLFKGIAKNDSIIKQFMVKHGIAAEDITFNPPMINDHEANMYSQNHSRFRYSINSNITIATNKVEAVRDLQQKMTKLIDLGIVINNSYASYEFTGLNNIKPQMIENATKNAREVAEKFAKDSESKLGKIKTASQGVFSIDNRDENTPHIKKVRVVTTVDYSLED